jgi:hypothetical protein
MADILCISPWSDTSLQVYGLENRTEGSTTMTDTTQTDPKLPTDPRTLCTVCGEWTTTGHHHGGVVEDGEQTAK